MEPLPIRAPGHYHSRFLEEKHFNTCATRSGSGPALACIFLEAMADGGVMMGLPRAEALELAALPNT